VAQAVPEFGELAQAEAEHFLRPKIGLESRPQRFAGENVLYLAKVAVF